MKPIPWRQGLRPTIQNRVMPARYHTVHRLDRPTSGVVLIAKGEEAARHLAEQFRTEQVSKTYWAICRGFCPEHQLIDYPLQEELDKIADKHASKAREPQKAITEIRRMGIAELALPVSRYAKSRFSLVECKPKTGRKHQIRRHLKHIRHPIMGDTRYGCRHHNKLARADLALESLALRAVEIEFLHPIDSNPVKVSAPLSTQWLSVVDQLGLSV